MGCRVILRVRQADSGNRWEVVDEYETVVATYKHRKAAYEHASTGHGDVSQVGFARSVCDTPAAEWEAYVNGLTPSMYTGEDDDDLKLSLNERIRRAEARNDWTGAMWLRERRGW